MNDVSRSYRVARAMVFITKIFLSFLVSLICYFIIELSSAMRGYFVTNIFIFIISFYLLILHFNLMTDHFKSYCWQFLSRKANKKGRIRTKRDYYYTTSKTQQILTQSKRCYKKIMWEYGSTRNFKKPTKEGNYDMIQYHFLLFYFLI